MSSRGVGWVDGYFDYQIQKNSFVTCRGLNSLLYFFYKSPEVIRKLLEKKPIKILDAGAGDCMVARNIYSMRTSQDEFDPSENKLYDTSVIAPPIYWVENKMEKTSAVAEYPEDVIQQSCKVVENANNISAVSISYTVPEFISDSNHKILKNRFFRDITNQEIVGEGEGFDFIVDMIGIFAYSGTSYQKSRQEVISRYMEMLKPDGMLAMVCLLDMDAKKKIEADILKIRSGYRVLSRKDETLVVCPLKDVFADSSDSVEVAE
ncbi:MAG: hypothetical protein OXE99_00085 [Cellvibrionales bacterium]|nr:hypothetical protein [Cellvibrionales bacterium]